MPSQLHPEAFEEKLRQDYDVEHGTRRLTCLSRQALPARLEEDGDLLTRLSARKKGTEMLMCTVAPSSSTTCSQCGGSSWQRMTEPESIVFLESQVTSMRFDHLVCTSCPSGAASPTTLHVDGKEWGVLRASATMAVGLDVLYNWRNKTKNGGVPWYTFWRDCLAGYVGADVAQQRRWMNLREAFENATLDFMQLQNLDLEGAFWCHCGLYLTIDAITVSIHRNQALIVHPWYLAGPANAAGDGSSTDVPLVYGSSHEDRIFVRSKDSRVLLLRYCGSSGLMRDRLQQLVEQLTVLGEGRGERTLLPLLEHPVVLADGAVRCAPSCRKLLRELATGAPVNAILKRCAYDIVDQLTAAEAVAPNLEQHQCLARHCPVLYGFLQPHLSAALAPELTALLKAMRHVSAVASMPRLPPSTTNAPPPRPISGRVAYQAACDAGLPRAEDWRSHDEAFVRTGCWGGPPQGASWRPTQYGGSHILYPLPEYDADLKRGKGKAETGCTKYKDQTKVLMPGLMLFWCGKCRKCVYFQMLADAESPAVVMQVLRTRWPVPPERIVYDNTCNAQTVALNREPAWFEPTEWFIDEPHYRGHKDCAASYNTGLYDMVVCAPLAEQHNKRLRHLEGHVSYMRQVRALYYLRYFLYLVNELEDDAAAGRCFYK